jgi:glycosyltransferase involved in cell wall biosynthesis
VKVSIIVPAFNEERELAGSLRSMRAAAAAWERRGWTTELIVCDNNSTDRTAAIAREAGALVVFEPVNQISRARNAGAAHATGEWLVFIDADSHPGPELFEDVAAAMESGRVLGGGCKVVFETTHLGVQAAASFWYALSRAFSWAAGSFVFCRADAFRELRGFTLELYASEEIDFSRRLKRLARARGQRTVILTRHPLVTSARKARLYTWGEVLRLMVKTMATGGRTLRSAKESFAWYDGRR